jgi:two-component system, NarL family, nitrate/nitrite sensor histidine kinase NarX
MNDPLPIPTLRPGPGAAPQEVDILAEIAAGLSSGRDLGTLLRGFLEPIVGLAGARAGAVRALSSDGLRLELVGSLGLPEGVWGGEDERVVDRHCGHCGSAADGRQVVWATDLKSCARRGAGSYFGQEWQRMLVVPLQRRGRLLGVYNLFFSGKAQPTPEVTAILKSVGELLGLALDNARLEAENLRATVVRERQMLAADVHDSIAQLLAFAKMRMPLLEQAIESGDSARSLRYCADVRKAVSDAHTGLREILTHFRSPMDPLGLTHALEAAARSFGERSGVEVGLLNEAGELHLPAERASQVFHIVQEALTNIAKHAQARHAWIALSRSGECVEIRVEDDGVGMGATALSGEPGHLGMGIMTDRARSLGGELRIDPRTGGGTSIRLDFPLTAATQIVHA